MDFVYSFSNGKLTATNIDTGEVMIDSCAKLRKQFAETGQLPAPFATRQAKLLIGVAGQKKGR